MTYYPELFTEANSPDIIDNNNNTTFIGRFDRALFNPNLPPEDQEIWYIKRIERQKLYESVIRDTDMANQMVAHDNNALLSAENETGDDTSEGPGIEIGTENDTYDNADYPILTKITYPNGSKQARFAWNNRYNYIYNFASNI